MLLDKEQYDTFEKIKDVCDASAENGNSKNVDVGVLGKILHINGELDKLSLNESNKIYDNNIFHDLEMFTTFGDDMQCKTLFSTIACTKLNGSKLYLKNIIENPVSDEAKLAKRVEILQNMNSKYDKDTHDKLFDILADNEDIISVMYASSENDLDAIFKIAYFNTFITKPLNSNANILTLYNIYKIGVSPLIGILSPIVYFLIPYIIIIFKFKLKISFVAYIKIVFNGLFKSNILGKKFKSINTISYALSLLFYFQGIFNSIEVSSATQTICRALVTRMNSMITFIKTSEQLFDELWSNDISSTFFNSENNYISKYEYKDISINRFKIFSSFGDQLKNFKFFKKDGYISLIRQLYQLDTIISICRAKDTLGFTYPKVIVDNGDGMPIIQASQIWHPSIKNAIKNTIISNTDGKSLQNIIITGPNAGGKSTIIKSILLSVLLSQSLCIVNAEDFTYTPLDYISSQMNIPDCKGKESLFEAEMHRSKKNLDKLEAINGKKSLIIMDEIFNSTNPVEGISGAYAIAKKISSYKSNFLIITTHYTYLTLLAKEFPEHFITYKMNVNINKNTKDITFPYKLKRGVSNQYIALDLLKNNGFDSNIINDALVVKNKLLTKSK